MATRNKRVAVRNPLHNHPLLGKGSSHRKIRKAQRRTDKQALHKEWGDPMASGAMGSRHSLRICA